MGLADGIGWLLDTVHQLQDFDFGALYPIMLIFGLHWGLVPLVMNNFATIGADPIFAITLATNFALAGCAFGVFLKTKNPELKQTAVSTGISAFVAGVTEPAIYGVVLKFKRPFVIVCLLDAIGGVLIATSGGMQTAFDFYLCSDNPCICCNDGKNCSSCYCNWIFWWNHFNISFWI